MFCHAEDLLHLLPMSAFPRSAKDNSFFPRKFVDIGDRPAVGDMLE